MWAYCGEETWKRDILIPDSEDLEMMDASDIYPRRIKAKEVLISRKDDEVVFPFADGTAKLSGRDYEFLESTVRRKPTVRSEDLSGGLQGKSEEPQPTEPTDNDEARNDFLSAQGHFINRHHSEPRVQLYVPKAKEESFPNPLKFIDVIQGESGESQPGEPTDDAEDRDDVWSIQGDFIYRHFTEPRVQLYVPKEETFPIPLKYIDLQCLLILIWMCYKKRNWRLLECRFEQEFVNFLVRIHEIYSIERGTTQRICVVRVETDKSSNDYETISCVAWSMDPNY